MNKQFEKYVKELGATKPIQDRVEYFYTLCLNVNLGQPICDIFIDEFLNQDKSRSYSSLSFFCPDYIFSIPHFLTSEDIFVGKHQTVQNNVRIILKNFDFKKANDQSLMSVELFYDDSPKGSYRASQKNCEHLVKIFKTYIKPTF